MIAHKADNASVLQTLKNPHTPSRKQAIVFLIFTLTIAGALAVWELFINFGTLVLLADGPMTAKVNGETIECEIPPCSVSLKPRTYTVLFHRNGHFDDTQKVTVTRFAQTPLEAHFSVIPRLKKYTKTAIPTRFPLTSLFTAPQELPNFPKNATAAVFSPTAQAAIITIDDALAFYSAKTGSVTVLTISPRTPFTWAGGSVIFFGLDAAKTQTVYRYGVDADTPLVRFERALVNPKIAGDPSGNFLIVSDLDTEHVHYLVDIKNLSKKRIQLNTTAELAGFTEGYALFSETTTMGETRLTAVPLASDALGTVAPAQILPKAIGGLATRSDENHLVYLTSEKTDLDGSTSQTSIEDVISQISEISTPEGEVSDASSTDVLENISRETKYTLYLTEFDLTTQKTKTLLAIPLAESQKISEMTNIQKTIFIRVGKEIFEIVK